MKQLANYLVFGNVLIALGAASLFWLTCALNNFAIEFDFAVFFVFSATLVTYILQRYLQLDNAKAKGFTERTTWISHNIQPVIFIGGVALVAAFFSFVLSGIKFYWWMFLPALAIIIYPLPILLGKKPKDFIVIKSIIIAAIWAFATVTIPFLLYELHPLENEMLYQFGERLIFILLLKLPFDLKTANHKTTSNINLSAIISGVALAMFYAMAYFFNHQSALSISQIVLPLFCILALTIFLLFKNNLLQKDWNRDLYLNCLLIVHFLIVFAIMQF